MPICTGSLRQVRDARCDTRVSHATHRSAVPCGYSSGTCTVSAVEGSLIAQHRDVGPLLAGSAQRAKLLEAMVQAVAEKGYAAATVADAVRLARVSRGTFYELFASKEACLAAAYRLGIEVLEERVARGRRRSGRLARGAALGIRAYLRDAGRRAALRARVPARDPRAGSARSARRAVAPLRRAATARASRAPGARARPTTRCSCSAPACTTASARAVRAGRRRSGPRRHPGGLRRAARHEGGDMDLTFNERGDRLPRRAARVARGQPTRRRPSPRARTRTTPGAATGSAASPTAAGPASTGRGSTAAAARR